MEEKRDLTILTDSSLGVRAQARPPVALVICDDPCADLGRLTTDRCKAALPFAGKYRLIDFALSNCVNSDIETVGVITQYKPRSLHSHVAYGRPWDLDRTKGGLTLLHPYQARTEMDWYTGSANAVYQNQNFFLRHKTGEVLILVGSQVCTMDFAPMISRHREAQADLTVAVVHTDKTPSVRHYTLEISGKGFVEKVLPPGTDQPTAAALMGVLLFSTEALNWRLGEDALREDSTHDLFRDVIPSMIQAGDRVIAFQHVGYWSSLQTARDYWQAGMDLLGESPPLNLQDASWPIRTQSEVHPPTRVSSGARIAHSLISEGCIVDGTVEYSILSPGVSIAPGAVVRHAIVMHNTSIEERAWVENAILDMDTIVGPQSHVGKSYRQAPTVREKTPVQLTIVQKGTRIPAQQTVEPPPETSDWLLTQQQDLSNRHADAA
jgi:glucose-1-phosphate adenylyltransferase